MSEYPHMCRDGHEEIGFSGAHELCPVCELRARIAAMREALEPFANLPCLENFDDDQIVDTWVYARQIRHARAALARAKGEE